MKASRALLWLVCLCLTFVSGLRAEDAAFEVRAVAPRPGLTGHDYVLDDGGGDPVTLALGTEVLLDTAALASAEAKEEDGQWSIAVTLTDAGRARFAEVTARFQGRRLAILIHDKIRCAPIVNTAITDGVFEIGGNFTADEVRALAADLNAAAATAKKASASPAP